MFVEIITESKEWTCPKTGTYLITCIGGGCGGIEDTQYSNLVVKPGGAGGATSFGNYITAPSAYGVTNPTGYNLMFGLNSLTQANKLGGIGYDLTGKPSAVQIKGYTFGNGGAAANYNSFGGTGGSYAIGTVELKKGETVLCTVGTGGAGTIVKPNASTPEPVHGGDGRDGAIFIKEV